MNQKITLVPLREFTRDDHPFGNVQGKDVFRKLVEFVESHPATVVFGISLEGIEATDASFPRESVVAVAKKFRGERGFYLSGIKDRDLLDNWDYAARAKEQPLVAWLGEECRIIGPEVGPSSKQLLDYMKARGVATAAKIAEALQISVPNASTKLKKLVDQGFILRMEDAAESGGIEFIYSFIGQSA